MKLSSALALLVFASTLAVVSCNRTGGLTTSTTDAIGVNSALAAPATRLFDRRRLDVSGFHNLNEFILPEVRVRLDQEPSGDSENGFVLPPVVTDVPDEETQNEQQEAFGEENPLKELEIENAKYLWAKKKFGDALAADENASGVIILYADDTFYDIGRLTYFVEEGRGRIAADSQIDPSRIQVVYGGYRGVAQVEFWLVPAGQNMPVFKPEERDARHDSDN
jgi:hypothetical protein